MGLFDHITKRLGGGQTQLPSMPSLTLAPAPLVTVIPVDRTNAIDVDLATLWTDYQAEHTDLPVATRWSSFLRALQVHNEQLAKDITAIEHALAARENLGEFYP